MLWRRRSYLARAAVLVTAAAIGPAILVLIFAALGDAVGGFGAFELCGVTVFAGICVWAAVGLRAGVLEVWRRRGREG